MSVLQLDKVNYTYPGNNGKVLTDVSHSFERGTFTAIVGSSGAGKSTLLSLLAGLDAPTKGAVLFEGKDIAETGYSKHRRSQISLVFQNYNLIEYLTPLENLRLVDRRASVQQLEELGLSQEQAKRGVLQLSGGQQQRVAIGRALVSKAPVILADEPTGNLDETTAEEVVGILRDAARAGKCVIVVTHSKQLAAEADEVLALKGRKLTRQR
uniref:ABC transporter ATP-binding protein n=1 Tax=Tessaracoccus timonensis TaxID=2161816 RepID=UPI000D54E7EE|nr:ABC transporter ATP-binding protein [Tessaracoccus timonensis]